MEYKVYCCDTWEAEETVPGCLVSSYVNLFSQAMEIVKEEDMVFQTRRELEINGDNREKLVKCQVYNKSFETNASLKVHNRIHTGERPYECKECHKRFTRKFDLKSHMITHTGEKAYECKQCHKCLSHKSTLKLHLKIHTGEKAYRCRQCHKAFTRRGTFK